MRLVTLALLLAGCPVELPDEPRGSWGGEELPRSACVGDGDGGLEPGELVGAGDLDLHATFTVSGERERPTDPWDLTPPVGADDRHVDLGPRPLDGFWFADRFAGADFASALDTATGTWGAYRLDEQGLWLLGIAGEVEGQTALTYTPPVPLLPLPMAEGDSWSVDAAAEGLADGEVVPRDLGADGTVSVQHRWAFEVLEAGTVSLPLGQVAALRVRATVAAEAHNSAVGLIASDLQRVDLYVAECLGLVGRVRSRLDEPAEDFTIATELLRLGLTAELRE